MNRGMSLVNVQHQSIERQCATPSGITTAQTEDGVWQSDW